MRIADMQVTMVAISDPPLLNAAGLHAPYALRLIVELFSDDGISGLGEIPGSVETEAALNAAREVVIGSDPFQRNALEAALRSWLTVDEGGQRGDAPWDARQFMHVLSALEVACLDLVGKAVGRPVCDLLGGRVRDEVPFAAYLFYKYEGAGGALGFDTDPQATGWAAARQAAALDPAGVVAQAQAMCAAFGFHSIKLKGGVFEPDAEVAAMHALHEAFGPEVPLRHDPNAVWSVETAIRAGKRMEGVLEYFEDPARGQANMAQVAQALDIPLATNMCTTSFADLPGSLRLGSEAIILSDHHSWGGLRNSVALARICQTFGRGLSMHSNSHLGISLAAMVQLGAAVPNLTYACDTHYPWQYEEVITGGRIPFEDGAVAVSREPGLGVTLDRAQVAELHAQYLESGLQRRNDEVEMQKVNPGWQFKATRW